MIVTEQWRPVVGYEGFYEVSHLGSVRSVDRVIEFCNQFGPCKKRLYGAMKSFVVDKDGYYKVGLHDGKQRLEFVHRVVAKAFIGPVPESMQVNHKDGNKKNNNPANLEYVTSGDNTRHAISNGLRNNDGEANPAAINTGEQIAMGLRLIDAGMNCAEAARCIGVNKQIMHRAHIGMNWSCLGLRKRKPMYNRTIH